MKTGSSAAQETSPEIALPAPSPKGWKFGTSTGACRPATFRACGRLKPTFATKPPRRVSLGRERFDAVVDFEKFFTRQHIEEDIRLFRDRTRLVRLHQLGFGVPQASSAPRDHGVDALIEPLLAAFR